MAKKTISDYKPFDTSKKPKKPMNLLMPIEWGGTAALSLPVGAKVRKHGMEDLKPPYLLLCNHAAFIDFPLVVKGTFPHKVNWVISIEEFNKREFLMRGIGGIYKRKFTSDLRVVRHMLTVLKKRKGIVVMYPEARFSLAGVNEQLDGAIGKFVKTAKCPVVVLISKGNFISSPQWNKNPHRNIPVSADMTQIVTAGEAQTLTAEEIQKRIEEAFVYDDYKWQKENDIHVKSKYRAHNIHRILYQCPVCGKEFSTRSRYTKIWCENCHAEWEMDELGQLIRLDGDNVFTHVPDWYRWEREQVREQVRRGEYRFEDDCRLEQLVNCSDAGFIPLGTVHLTHDENGFTMNGTLDDGTEFKFNRTVKSMYSCHIEYNFKKRGDAIDLATLNETYFVFPLNAFNCLTKIHFAAEELHRAEKDSKAGDGSEKTPPDGE